MESYIDMKKRHHDEVNNFPMIFLFGKKSDEELKKEFASIGAKSKKDLISIGGGGYIHKDKVNDFTEMFARHERELKELRSDPEFLYQMFSREMGNHEYGYTRDPETVLTVCGVSLKQLEEDPVMAEAWRRAEKECFAWYDAHQ